MLLSSFFRHLQATEGSLPDKLKIFFGYNKDYFYNNTTGLINPVSVNTFFELFPSTGAYGHFIASAKNTSNGEFRLRMVYNCQYGYNGASSLNFPIDKVPFAEVGIGYGPGDVISRSPIYGLDSTSGELTLNPDDVVYTKVDFLFRFNQSPVINPVIIDGVNYGGRLLYYKNSPVGMAAPVLMPYAVHGPGIIPSNAVLNGVPSDAFIIPYDQHIEKYSPYPNNYYATKGFYLNKDQGNFIGGISAIYLKASSNAYSAPKTPPMAVLALDTPIPKTSLLKLEMNDLIKTTWSVVNAN